VTVSRQALIASNFSTVTCAPVYSRHDGLSTQVRVGADVGLKSESSIHCDELVSMPKSQLTRDVGRLGEKKIRELNQALLVALELEDAFPE
jgi:mRNA interferase MazF